MEVGMSGGANIPYEVVTEKAWGEAIADTFVYAPWHGSWMYSGACPRCRHKTTTSVGRAFMQKMITFEEKPPEPVFLDELPVECSCGEQRAPDKTGCGAYAVVYNVNFK